METKLTNKVQRNNFLRLALGYGTLLVFSSSVVDLISPSVLGVRVIVFLLGSFSVG